MRKFLFGITSSELQLVIAKAIANCKQFSHPASFLLVMALLAAAHDAQAQDRPGILRISPLRIMCFTTPCPPWNAMAISRGAEAPGPHPLYLGALPSLRGSKSAVRRIAATWRQKGCVIIRGRLDRSGKPAVLFIGRILRSC